MNKMIMCLLLTAGSILFSGDKENKYHSLSGNKKSSPTTVIQRNTINDSQGAFEDWCSRRMNAHDSSRSNAMRRFNISDKDLQQSILAKLISDMHPRKELRFKAIEENNRTALRENPFDAYLENLDVGAQCNFIPGVVFKILDPEDLNGERCYFVRVEILKNDHVLPK
jgi:hypothetical protein